MAETTASVQMIMGYGASAPDDLHPARVERVGLHRDLSCVLLMPVTAKGIPPYVVDSWLSLVGAPNQPRTQIMVKNAEVGEAYNLMFNAVLNHPVLASWRWVVTLEHDNVPPPFGLVDLLAAADEGDWDVLGGLYFTKGVDGVPQIWGDRRRPLQNAPWSPWLDRTFDYQEGQIVECWGTGMGFTAFRMATMIEVLAALPAPWFETTAGEAKGVATQDLAFFRRAHAVRPLKVGVHTGIKVGHYDDSTGIPW